MIADPPAVDPHLEKSRRRHRETCPTDETAHRKFSTKPDGGMSAESLLLRCPQTIVEIFDRPAGNFDRVPPDALPFRATFRLPTKTANSANENPECARSRDRIRVTVRRTYRADDRGNANRNASAVRSTTIRASEKSAERAILTLNLRGKNSREHPFPSYRAARDTAQRNRSESRCLNRR